MIGRYVQSIRPTRASLRGRRKILALILVVLGLAVTARTSLALFTDSDAVSANAFTVGDVELGTAPTSAVVTYSGMVPGDEVTGALTVSNDGNIELRYAVTATTDEDTLAAQLDLTIKVGVTTCTNAGFDTDGTVVYATGDLGSIAGIDVIGDPATGAQAGDRTLAVSGTEELCFNVVLPASTPASFEGTSSTATFTFASEQTANNP